MKQKIVFIISILFAMASIKCLAQNSTIFEELYKTGQAHQEADRYNEARAAYEKALDLEGITADQTYQALVNLADLCIAHGKVRNGRDFLHKAYALEGVSNPSRTRINLTLGQSGFKYPADFELSKTAFTKAIGIPDISPEQAIEARQGLIKALMRLKEFSEARSVMLVLADDANLTPDERVKNQTAIGTTFLLEGMYDKAKTELSKALNMDEISNVQRADTQMKLALSYYEAGDYERAKPELEKTLTVPGVDNIEYRRDEQDGCLTPPAREAKLRLLKMNPSDEKEKTVTALFIGSSMTLRHFMPFLVERLSAGAPVGRPRIVSGMYTRSGTRLNTFWDEGEAGGTVRSVIASGPWDYVVVETYRSMKLDGVLKYGKLYTDFIRSRKMEPIFYETHTQLGAPFPEMALEYHARNIELRNTVEAPVAPVALAEIYYLEAVPTAKREEFHADYIHPSTKGVYLEAYCAYSAITGYSPVGLAYPKSISADDAKALQEAAWKAIRETNPNLKPLN